MCRVGLALSLIASTLWFAQAWAQSGESEVEEIYITRSVRQSRVVPSEFCAPNKTGFAPALEDQLGIKSVNTRPSDGRMTGTNDADVGDMRICVGQAMDPTVLGTYAEGHVAGVAFTGVGDCRLVRGNLPEEGLLTHRCFLALSGLPQPYVGGFMVSSSVYSRTPFGEQSSPPGYAQAGLMIFRLFKRRQP
ncbi:hypothetical protein ACQR1W_11100 [Bradyrhizobium sp. HKCCYLS1011]|uniref:hypothetical protein n=1 Tax=Bradyrhizobium sp. HKCCYLS1011 TaxID=3420733 RepID=UPI003EBD4D90